MTFGVFSTLLECLVSENIGVEKCQPLVDEKMNFYHLASSPNSLLVEFLFGQLIKHRSLSEF